MNSEIDIDSLWETVNAKGASLSPTEYDDLVIAIWMHARRDAEALWQLGIKLGFIRSFEDVAATLDRLKLPPA